MLIELFTNFRYACLVQMGNGTKKRKQPAKASAQAAFEASSASEGSGTPTAATESGGKLPASQISDNSDRLPPPPPLLIKTVAIVAQGLDSLLDKRRNGGGRA